MGYVTHIPKLALGNWTPPLHAYMGPLTLGLQYVE